MRAKKEFEQILKQNREGKRKGVYSLCSAHPAVLRAGIRQAKEDGTIVIVEATSNQVDQYGGYTGMIPSDFVAFVYEIAEKEGYPKERILLGGDHLGPNGWQKERAEEAMRKADRLVEEYVKAGFQKIHLDASMFLEDDEGDRSKPLSDAVVAERTVRLCRKAENAFWQTGRSEEESPLYVIGTEVPIPGGATESEESLTPTAKADVRKTVAAMKEAFWQNDLQEAWKRVVGVVVQPGVEFGDDQVFDYDPALTKELSFFIEENDGLVFEAHSTDYQTVGNLTSMVEDHFCILKVGPWLTYAYREVLFALAQIEKEVCPEPHSNLPNIIEEVMLASPGYWQNHYRGTEKELEIKRKYSYSDRIRYYWNNEKIEKAIDRMLENLNETTIPLSCLSQYLPMEYHAIRGERQSDTVDNIIDFHIRTVTGIYSKACGRSK